jgi:hypothetical protein
LPDAPIAFFSYSREDSEFALRLAADLKAAGSDVWIDQIDIGPGELWDRKVQSALESCPCLLLILSPASVNSNNVLDEVSYALDKQKTLIPILHRDCDIPFRIRRFQHLDFRTDYDHMLAELRKCLHSSAPTLASASVSSSPIAPTPVTPLKPAPAAERSPDYPAAPPQRSQPPEPVKPAGGGFSMPVWITIAVVAIALVIGIYFMVGAGSGKRSDAERAARLSQNQSKELLQGGAAAADITGTAIAHAQTSPPCTLPSMSESDFSTTDPTVYFFFAFRHANPSDQWTIDWVEPNGYVHKTNTVAHAEAAGHYCFEMKITGGPAAKAPGEWTVRLNRNGTEVAEKTFRISGQAGTAPRRAAD